MPPDETKLSLRGWKETITRENACGPREGSRASNKAYTPIKSVPTASAQIALPAVFRPGPISLANGFSSSLHMLPPVVASSAERSISRVALAIVAIFLSSSFIFDCTYAATPPMPARMVEPAAMTGGRKNAILAEAPESLPGGGLEDTKPACPNF